MIEDTAAMSAIAALLAERGPGKTVCPSEVARRLAGGGPDWRAEMARVHGAVDLMAGEGTIALSWKGRALPARDGPYRIRALP